MRVLQVTNGYPPAARGGVETYTQAVAQALAGRGHAVEVFARLSALGEPEYAVHHDSLNGIPVRSIVNDLTDAPRFEQRYRNARVDAGFVDHLAAFRPEVVHVQHVLGLSATLLAAARARGVGVVVTLHDFWWVCPRATLLTAGQALCPGPVAPVDCVTCLGGVRLGPASAMQRLPAYKWLLARLPHQVYARSRRRLSVPASRALPAERVARHRRQVELRTALLIGELEQVQVRLAPSRFVQQVYAAHGLPAERVEVVPLGLDFTPKPLTRLQLPKNPGVVVTYIGALVRQKGPDVLLRGYAIASLPGELRLYGQAQPQDAFAGEVQAAAAQDARVRIMGTFDRQALADILAQTDVLVIPSRFYETYSFVAREALQAGVPVIASALGALPEVVRDGENGRLVPPGDAEALAQALEWVAARLPRLRAGARTTQAGPSMPEHVSALEHYYARAVEGCPREPKGSPC